MSCNFDWMVFKVETNNMTVGQWDSTNNPVWLVAHMMLLMCA